MFTTPALAFAAPKDAQITNLVEYVGALEHASERPNRCPVPPIEAMEGGGQTIRYGESVHALRAEYESIAQNAYISMDIYAKRCVFIFCN